MTLDERERAAEGIAAILVTVLPHATRGEALLVAYASIQRLEQSDPAMPQHIALADLLATRFNSKN